MAKVVITVPGERVVEEFTALVPQVTTPSTAQPVNVGLVEISQSQPTALIPGPVGPQGPRGSRWYTGDGPPSSTTGYLLGDMYVDDVTGDVWTWDGTQWLPTGTNIQGSPDTPAQVLAKIIQVDGPNSGLDADLLDGQHGAYYLDWANFTGKPATYPPTLPIPSPGVTGLDAAQAAQDSRLTSVESINTTQTTRLDAVEAKNTSQDTAINGKEPTIAAGNPTYYWRGDKTWQPIPPAGIPEAPQDGLTYGRKNAAWATVIGGAWTIQTTVVLTSGNYTKPANLKFVDVWCVGGGGGSNNVTNSSAGNSISVSGGGGGAVTARLYAAADLAASEAYSIGAGGGVGAAGGNTIFKGMTAGGGGAGVNTANGSSLGFVAGGIRGSPSGGDGRNFYGGNGEMGIRCAHGSATCAYGGGGGGNYFTEANPGNTSVGLANGSTGLIPGGGARGGSSAGAAGAITGALGGDGCIYLTEYF